MPPIRPTNHRLWIGVAIVGVLIFVAAFVSIIPMLQNVGYRNVASVGCTPITVFGQTISCLTIPAPTKVTTPAPSSGSPVNFNNAVSNTSGAAALVDQYAVSVSKNVPLTTASTTIAKAGGKVLFAYPYIHALAVRFSSAAQAAQAAKISGIVAVQPVELEKEQQVSQGSHSVRVAIVDNFDGEVLNGKSYNHGDMVVATYKAACGASCPDPNPMQIDATDGDGNITNTSVANGIAQAVAQGATIINVSLGPTNSGTGLDQATQDALEAASTAGATVVVSAGDDKDFVTNFDSSDNIDRDSVVVVGGTNPSNSSQVASDMSQYADTFMNPNSTPDATGVYGYGTSFASPKFTADLALTEAKENTNTSSDQAVGQAIQETIQNNNILTSANFPQYSQPSTNSNVADVAANMKDNDLGNVSASQDPDQGGDTGSDVNGGEPDTGDDCSDTSGGDLGDDSCDDIGVTDSNISAGVDDIPDLPALPGDSTSPGDYEVPIDPDEGDTIPSAGPSYENYPDPNIMSEFARLDPDLGTVAGVMHVSTSTLAKGKL